MNHGGKRKRAGRKPGVPKIYWAIRLTAKQRNMIRQKARKYHLSYGEFIYQCVQSSPTSRNQ
jgi:hypothetical protein